MKNEILCRVDVFDIFVRQAVSVTLEETESSRRKPTIRGSLSFQDLASVINSTLSGDPITIELHILRNKCQTASAIDPTMLPSLWFIYIQPGADERMTR